MYKALRMIDRSQSSFWSMTTYRGLKSYSEIPVAPRIPILGSIPYFLMAGGVEHMHEYIDRLHKNLGPIFRDNFKRDMIFIADTDAHYTMFHEEGEYPKHVVPESWDKVLKEIGKGRGLFFMDDEEWYKPRKIIDKIMNRPASLRNHVQNVSIVCKDFMDIWKMNPPSTNLQYQLSCWNVECFGEVVFGSRLGFMEKLRTDKVTTQFKREEEFVKASNNVFLESANMYSLPVKFAKILKRKSWKRFYAAMKTVLDYGEIYVQQAIKDCQEEHPSEKIRESIVYKALEGQLSKEIFEAIIADLFLASTDTTTHAASWMLYLLGRNRDIQAQAREEIFSILKENEIPTQQTIESIKHIGAIVKETLRLYSVVPFLTRIMTKDVILCDYIIPTGTIVLASLLTMGKDENNFTYPELFRPARWIENRRSVTGVIKESQNTEEAKELQNAAESKENRKANTIYKNHNNRAHNPFAWGKRACVGKHLAELNLRLLVLESLRTFEWSADEEVGKILRLVTVPSKDIKLRLKPLKY